MILIAKPEKQYQSVNGTVIETITDFAADEDVEVTVSASASVQIAIESEFYLAKLMTNATALAETEDAYCDAATVELAAENTEVNECELEITEDVPDVDPRNELYSNTVTIKILK